MGLDAFAGFGDMALPTRWAITGLESLMALPASGSCVVPQITAFVSRMR
jgi:hypothetical protein